MENQEVFGVETCEKCLTAVVPDKKSRRGITTPLNERQFDHIHPDSLGGDNNEKNTRILCRRYNRGLSDSLKPNYRFLNRPLYPPL